MLLNYNERYHAKEKFFHMEKGCNIRDVAKKAGVSPGTVSRVLNNRMGRMQVSEATRALILRCAKELDYQPNINARRLFSKQSRVVGLVIPSIREIHGNIFADRHIMDLLCGIEQVLALRKYKLLLLFKDRDFIESEEYLSLYRGKQIDGLLIWGSHRSERFWKELEKRNYPHVFITTCPDGLATQSHVYSADYASAAYDVMRYLLRKKHRRILWAEPVPDSSLRLELTEGFRRAFQETGCSMKKVLSEVVCGYSPEDGYNLMEELGEDRTNYSAILFSSCNSALGALDYCAKFGIRVPLETAIAACDNNDTGNVRAKITCACCDDILLGKLAAEALIAGIEGKALPGNRKVKTVFLPGDTA